jgi:hydrophobic/amphiphilic exporter-1 (mainly G- bacteria), HAE1 family
MWFTRVSLSNPVFATMMMLAIVVLGLFSYQRLKVDQFPNIDFPVVVVVTDYPGASPEIVEAEVSKRIEEVVNTIAGISAVSSRSYEGASVVIIEFNLNMDGRKAADEVREKVAIVQPLLRAEVKAPRVSRFDPSARAVFSVAVLPDTSTAKGAAPSQVELTNWATENLKKRLEAVGGVGAVNVVGGTRREINLYLNPAAMESLGVTVDQVTSAIRAENQDIGIGSIRTREQDRVVQLQARMQRPEDFGRIIVARKAGAPIRLDQVASIQDGAQERENSALYNGERALLLSVQKNQGDNTIEVVDGLRKALAEANKALPAGVRLEPIQDNSRPIRVSVANVQRTLIEGAILTVLIVFLFLNSWRSTVITGLTLPIALIGTFLFMYLFGFTINNLTLMALSLCVGLLIDDAIVVRENIVRHVQMGKSPQQASMEGTNEIGLAVLATTMSIVAVFLPIGFMGGIIGKFFHEFGITIVAAVLISMFVSFTLDPMLSSVWHDPEIDRHGGKFEPKSFYDHTLGRITHAFDRFTHWLIDGYQTALRWSLRFKITTLVISFAIFVASVLLVPRLGTEFVPQADLSETAVSFFVPVGSAVDVTEDKAKQVEALARSFPEVRFTLASVNTGNAQGKNNGYVYIRLVDRKDRKRSMKEINTALRERLGQIAGVTVTQVGPADAVGGGKQIEFSLQGTDLRELERQTARILERMAQIPGAVDLDSSVKQGRPVIDVQVKREVASDLGLNVSQIGNGLRTLVAGQTVGLWRAPNDQTYDVNLRVTPEFRSSTADLARMPLIVQTPEGARTVRLSQVAEVKESQGSAQVNRRDLLREVSINANVSGRSAGEVQADVRKMLDDLNLPPGYRAVIGGSGKNMQESFGFAIQALAMAIIFIYMILASQFKSFLQPISLMMSLPLTLIGVVGALAMFGSTLSMFSVIGIIMLMGLVTKNAILLVDFANRAIADGMAREAALLEAAKVRLRPILMTTLAMVFGMVPLAFALTEGSEQRAPLGQAVIGGVITSSILTLVVVPVVYGYMDDLGKWFVRKLGFAPKAA